MVDMTSWNSRPPNKDEGMIVTVVEEMASGSKHKTEPAPRFNMKEGSRRETILLVEDSPVMEEFYRRMLEGNSYSVLTTDEGKSAVDCAANNRVRLILIDDGGHVRNALRIAKQLRAEPRTSTIPVLMMLPIDTFRRLRSKIKPYVDMCIPKTFTSSILMPSLQSLLSS
jgi:DNA-binding response OmpR family regulator